MTTPLHGAPPRALSFPKVMSRKRKNVSREFIDDSDDPDDTGVSASYHTIFRSGPVHAYQLSATACTGWA